MRQHCMRWKTMQQILFDTIRLIYVIYHCVFTITVLYPGWLVPVSVYLSTLVSSLTVCVLHFLTFFYIFDLSFKKSLIVLLKDRLMDWNRMLLKAYTTSIVIVLTSSNRSACSILVGWWCWYVARSASSLPSLARDQSRRAPKHQLQTQIYSWCEHPLVNSFLSKFHVADLFGASR